MTAEPTAPHPTDIHHWFVIQRTHLRHLHMHSRLDLGRSPRLGGLRRLGGVGHFRLSC